MTSASTTATKAAQTEYRVGPLWRNRLDIKKYVIYKESQEMIHRLPEVNALLKILDSEIDPHVELDPSIREKLNSMNKPFCISEGGYKRKEVIEQAVRLYDAVPRHDAVTERAWTVFMQINVWDFFALDTDLLWRDYDPALKQLIPNRHLLSRPKPDFAIGLQTRSGSPSTSPSDLDLTSDFNEMAENYKYHSIPAVNLFVQGEILAFPFFICESKSIVGSFRTAENQMANSMVMAHDILCSLNAQDDLYILGLVQLAEYFRFYVSFSTRILDEEGKPFTQKIRIIQLDQLDLEKVSGCLSLLKFVEYVREYGETTFARIVKEKLALAFPPTP